MRILWLTNMIPSLVQQALGGKSGGGVWVDHVLSDLMEGGEDELLLLCRSSRDQAGILSEKIAFRLFSEPSPDVYYPALEGQFETLVREFSPDVIHIWGTEFGHTLAMMRALKTLGLAKKAVISIQGLCCYVAQHYYEGIPEKVVHAYSLRDLLKHNNLVQQAACFARRGQWEREALLMASHVIGRTHWDRACARQMNPALQYHFCNETMRTDFYSDAWAYDTCQKHLIFAPNWSDPRKGFHYLLRALAQVKQEFPDAQIAVTGRSYYPQDFKAKVRMSAYQKYLISLTDRFGLKDSIHFLGSLNAQQMKAAFLKANVYALPSTMENSPNTLGEAMLLGVPSVSADVGGVPSLMLHEQEGFVYQSTAEYMLAHFIMEVFRMEGRAQALGRAACAHAKKTHDPRTNLETLQKIYRLVGEDKE